MKASFLDSDKMWDNGVAGTLGVVSVTWDLQGPLSHVEPELARASQSTAVSRAEH